MKNPFPQDELIPHPANWSDEQITFANIAIMSYDVHLKYIEELKKLIKEKL